MRLIVRQQTELGSRQWGVYVGKRLIEGGFFSRTAALAVSDRVSTPVCSYCGSTAIAHPCRRDEDRL